MHIPDGFLSPPVAVATGIASAAVIAVALNRTRASLGLRQAPIMGLTTAFVFAAQMINFPVARVPAGTCWEERWHRWFWGVLGRQL